MAKKFVREMKKEMWAINNIYQDMKDMVMTEEDKKTHESSMTCHICSKELNDNTVRDHDHITGKYRGAAHSESNLAFQLPKFVPTYKKMIWNRSTGKVKG